MSSIDQTLRKLEQLGWWYQHFKLPNGVPTGSGEEPGYDPEQRWNLIKDHVPADLSGKTVLDLGGNAGYFSIQMKLRGAARCVLVEPYREFLAQAQFAAGEFGVELEYVNEDATAYCLTTEERFDYVLFLGLLYHLRYPTIVLDRAAEMTKERLFLVSAVIGPPLDQAEVRANYDRSEDRNLLDDPSFPKMVFLETRYYGDPTNWWLPNHAALPALLRSAGMKVIARPHSQVLIAEPEQYFGKVVYEKLVISKHGKRDGSAIHPGPQVVDPGLWSTLGESAKAHIERLRKSMRDEAK